MAGRRISACRACGNTRLSPVLDLGDRELSGVFPRPSEVVPQGSLNLVRCGGSPNGSTCGLLQLESTYPSQEMFGDNYGYRSGLNPSMQAHLRELKDWTCERFDLDRLRGQGLAILDVGSNDGSFLGLFEPGPGRLIGVDPTIRKFAAFYRSDIEKIPDFFPSGSLDKALGGTKVALLSSIAMFYDLEDPVGFARGVRSILDPDGHWLFEQSYLPDMLANSSYDTVCHEHLEYYSLRVIRWILRKAELKIVDIRRSRANGGSLAVLASPLTESSEEDCESARALMEEEARTGLDTPGPYEDFARSVEEHASNLAGLVRDLARQGSRIWGYAASTKGNIILQKCGLGPRDLKGILEVNQDKFGRVTPGTGIPILDESSVSLGSADVLLILPWHFRDFFMDKLDPLRRKGIRILFPLPRIELVEPL